LPDIAARQDWMGLLSRARPADLEQAFGQLGPVPAFVWLRRPETGSVMLRGRAGGTGAPFNLGEMTVTRCALELADGTTGHAWVQCRDMAHAERAALVDALMQGADADRVRATVLEPLRQAETARHRARDGKAAATRVEFFTLVRGEDA
jgi:alpha-D-ribose 1-methylphosphonate 5-triphosphate synthase subunit PhnG